MSIDTDVWAGSQEGASGSHAPKSVTDVSGRPLNQMLPAQSTRTSATISASRPLPAPVFVHSSFRTSSTWIWNSLRRLPNTVAYYEVFNEGLQTLDARAIGAIDHATWMSHHPPQAPYFLEFLPLLKPVGGVLGFDSTMSLDRFMPAAGFHGDLSLEEQAYLQILVEQAHRGDKIPVLTDTRSIGRMAAIKRCMTVKNVLLHRNLFHQWASYSGQFLRGNSYFLNTIDTTIKACASDAFLSQLDAFFVNRTASPQDEQTFVVFIVMHLYLYAHAIDAADVVIDTTALALDRDLRYSVESDLSQLVDGPIDLSDARLSFEISIVAVRDRIQFVNTIEQFVKLITSTCASERAAAFVLRLKDQTLAEWSRHDGFTRPSIAWHFEESEKQRQQIEEKATAQAAAEAVVAALTGERDATAAQLATTAAGCQAAQASAAALAAERDGLVAQLITSAAAHQAAESAAAALTEERDVLAVRLAAAAASREAIEASAAALTVERDRLAADGEASREAAEARFAALTRESADLSAEVAASVAARQAAEVSVAILAAERDDLVAKLTAREAAEAEALTPAADQAKFSPSWLMRWWGPGRPDP